MLVHLVLLVICQTIMADFNPKPFYPLNNLEVVGGHFERFIQKYNKQYGEYEKLLKFQVFIENLKIINAYNAKYKLTTFDINQFTDLSQMERRSLFGYAVTDPDAMGKCLLAAEPTTRTAPAAWDWRDMGAVSPVKRQGNCRACWAFSATGMLESRIMQKGKIVSLSEQQMVDCDSQSDGCNGGLMTLGLTEIMNQGGQDAEAAYPYGGAKENCRFDSSKVEAKVTNCSAYSVSSEEALKELLVKEGPLAIGVQANDWVHYHKGIFEGCEFERFNHGVLLVGYGTENNEDFWVIKNSWGPDFGENGFIRIKRGVHCAGIATNNPISVVSANVA